jgi:anionic cell wall polymer biosynthesis LytR-Cps2A-Psr (LCP) family protein
VTATVVGVMDRDSWTARTDNVVVVDAKRRRLVWVPRDLWSDAVGDRINEAFAQGGHDLLEAAVREHGLPAESSVVLLRSGVERALEGLRVTVPVDRRRRYWYPLTPTLRLQDGRKLVCFDPPLEALSGERIHQWVGARRSADGPSPTLPDLDRIERQQVLVRTLLEDGFAFAKALEDPALASIAGSRALDVLGAVRATWDLETHRRFQPATVEGKMVLLGRRRRLLSRRRRVWRAGR